MSDQAIGLFDSGVGGLSVFSELTRQLSQEEVIYFADTKHMPYGSRSRDELRRLVFAILDWLVDQQVKLVIMACNTSSALILDLARDRYSVPILGMIRPTAEALGQFAGQRLGIMATEATIRSDRYRQELLRAGFAGEVHNQPCPRLASLIESGADQTELASAVSLYLRPLQQASVQRLVLACTHYPFAADLIADYLGNEVELVDPAKHVIRKAGQLLSERRLGRSAPGAPRHRFYTSGNVDQFRRRAARLLGQTIEVQAAQFVQVGDELRVEA